MLWFLPLILGTLGTITDAGAASPNTRAPTFRPMYYLRTSPKGRNRACVPAPKNVKCTQHDLYSNQSLCELRCQRESRKNASLEKRKENFVESKTTEHLDLYYYDKPDKKCYKVPANAECTPHHLYYGLKSCETRCNATSRKNICKMLPETGRCKASFRKYYYDSRDKTCKAFTWGGCGGNANKFDTKSACEEHCKVVPTTPKPKCPKNETYKICVSSSCGERRCGEPKPVGCTLDCASGCFCKYGYYRVRNGTCVRKSHCPRTDLTITFPPTTSKLPLEPEVFSPNSSSTENPDAVPKKKSWKECLSKFFKI
ncbi:actinia tenebrosa protease inhibitors-like [Ixodes scapularis]|uniref:actinia tenebrosa protease inhibitors-like n=1 Tax=Ixodes scapularis TaxID=6945 RepID=UPI001A9D5709|nr:actinia tenebrosa protease inhibitors-like [Ixodes scapularis]